MQETKENFRHLYHLSVESFNSKDYATFFRNIRPGMECLSQYLIFDFMGDESEAMELINGEVSIIKDRNSNTYSISKYPPNYKPTGRVFCDLFPKAYYCKHLDVTDRNAVEQKRRIKRGLDSCSAEMGRYYCIASEIGSHAGRSTLDIAVQARGCASFFMGFLDYIKCNQIVSESAGPFLDSLDVFIFSETDNTYDYQNEIERLIKVAEEKETALLLAQKMQLEAEQAKMLAEQQTYDAEKKNAELEEQLRFLQDKLNNQLVTIDSHEGGNTEVKKSNLGEEIHNKANTADNNQDNTRGDLTFRSILQGVNKLDIPEETMDDDQLDLIEYTDDKSMLVAGCAGSGKSVIAMHKAEQLHRKGKDVILIAYTKSLSRFMWNGKDDATFRLFHHYFWKHKLNMPKADYIIVDEIQDFTREEIQEFINAARQHFLFFGDTAQSIYRQYGKETMTIDQIANMTGLKTLHLFNNYRLPRPVAKITQDFVGVNVPEYKEKVYQNRESELPHFIHFDSEQAQIEALLKLVNDNRQRNIGILLPNNPEVIRMSLAFEDNDVECEFKYNKGNNDFDYVDSLDFNTLLPKIMTYHSAKGLQFDMVILPLYNGANDEESRKALYVAMTRTIHTLYVLYSTPTLLPPLNVPPHLYLKQ